MSLLSDYLTPRGVTDGAVIAARGYEEVDNGIRIPLYTIASAAGDGLPYGHEVRLIPPKITRRGDKTVEQKFDRPKGQDQQLSVNPYYWERPLPGKPLWIVEGTSRADALHERGVNSVVSLTSCWGWKNGKTGVDSQLDELALRDQEVWLWFDGDITTKRLVNLAAHRLSAVLESRGALVRYGLVPDGLGLDDYLAAGNDVTALRGLLVDDLPMLEDQAVTEEQFIEGSELPRTSDAALARDWLSRCEEVCHVDGQWLAHVKGRWQQTPGGSAARTRLLPYLEGVGLGYQTLGEQSDSPKARAFGRKTREILESSAKGSSVLTQGLAVEEGLRHLDDFDRDPWLLNLANGTLDIRTREFGMHDPKNMLTGISPTIYDPNAGWPEWQRFLDSALPDREVQRYAQRMLGAMLPGMTLSQRVLVFSGRTRAGKGTMIRALSHMLGRDYSGELRREVIMKGKGGSSDHQTQVMWLKGKRMAAVNETNEGEEFDAAKLKTLSGGDEITARGMNQDQQTFKPSHNLILSTNALPNVDSADIPLWGRLRVIPFRQTFLGREDETLDHRLAQEASGILNWLLVGLATYLQEGEGPLPSDVAKAKQEWRDTGDSVAGYADSLLQGDRPKGGWMSRGDMRTKYERWCDENDMQPIPPTSGKWKAGLTAKGFEEVQVPRGVDAKRPRMWGHAAAWQSVTQGEEFRMVASSGTGQNGHGTGSGTGVELELTCMEPDELELIGTSWKVNSHPVPSLQSVLALIRDGSERAKRGRNSGATQFPQVNSSASSGAKIVSSGSTPVPVVALSMLDPEAPI